MNRRKKIGMILMCLMLIFSFVIPVSAADYQNGDTVYDAYVYDNGEPMEIQMPYTFEKKLKEKFQEISDLFFCRENQRLYVADRQANSIVILNSKFEKTHVLNTFDNH